MNCSAFLLIFASIFVVGSATGNCDGFAPSCSCNEAFSSLYVVCNAPVAAIKKVFSKLKVKSIYQLSIYMNVSDSIIIANVTGNVKIETLTLACPFNYARPNFPKFALAVDPAAFSQSKLATEELYIKDCDLSKLNWGFLKGFTKLGKLEIRNCNNFPVNFNTLPSASLTSLSRLKLVELSDLNKFLTPNFKYPALLKNGLTNLMLIDVVYPSLTTDAIIQNFLANWVTPSSRKTLTELAFIRNKMSKVPLEIAKYDNLNSISFFMNTQPWVIQANAFNFTKNATKSTRFLEIFSSQITSIQPGAFQGFYGNWYISLSGNLLTQLSSSVFQPLLQQMAVSNGYGYLNVGENPFDCVKSLCNLAWLIRDNRNYLKNMFARCSNGTNFNQLNPLALRFSNGKKYP